MEIIKPNIPIPNIPNAPNIPFFKEISQNLGEFPIPFTKAMVLPDTNALVPATNALVPATNALVPATNALVPTTNALVPAGVKDTVFSVLSESGKDLVNFLGQKVVNGVSSLASKALKRRRKRGGMLSRLASNFFKPSRKRSKMSQNSIEPEVVGTFVSKPKVEDVTLENEQQVPLVPAAVSESPIIVEPQPVEPEEVIPPEETVPSPAPAGITLHLPPEEIIPPSQFAEVFPSSSEDDLPPAPGVELHSTRNRKVLRCYRCGTFVSRNKPHSIDECNERIRKFKANRGKRKSTTSTKRKRKVEKELLKSFRTLERKNAAAVGIANAVAKKARSLIEKYKNKSKIPKQIVNFLKYVDKKIQ